jgi:cupin fold WbuC family metalloprotein
MPLAPPDLLKLVPHALLDELAAKAATSPRARAHHNIHATPADPVQRFLVVAQGDSYFRPHRHASRSELALLVRGRLDVLIFDERGRVLARHPVGEKSASLAYETPQGVWHTVVPVSGGCAFLEIKEGPYDPATSVQFAEWAPAEGDAAVPGFRTWLRSARPGEFAPAAPP